MQREYRVIENIYSGVGRRAVFMKIIIQKGRPYQKHYGGPAPPQGFSKGAKAPWTVRSTGSGGSPVGFRIWFLVGVPGFFGFAKKGGSCDL